MNIVISAVICTYNREDYIETAIRSLMEQTLDDYLYEIIVVDNRSTDHTEHIVKSLAESVGNLSYIFEENVGLSFARNTGWRNARGRYVAFLDDDAEASETWLANIVACLERSDDKTGSVGGPVEPIYETPPPRWLTPTMKRSLAIVDWGGGPRVLDARRWLAGVNVAFKKNVLETCGGFNTSLGRKGKNLLSMEETFLREQMEKNGIKSFYHPDIRVKHHISRRRLTRGWFMKRSYWQGVSEAGYDCLLRKNGFFARLGCFFSYLKQTFKSNGSGETRNRKPSLFDVVCFFFKNVGYCRGMFK